MLTNLPIQNILFLDVETVPQQSCFEKLPIEWKELWAQKSASLLRNREEETIESIYERAGIYAEFGKIICISCGVIHGNDDTKKLILKSFAGNDEKKILDGFSDMLQKWTANESKFLCAHNGKEFDFPYICRRLIINNMPLPLILNTAGKKPWEVNHLDTMELWKFGDFKNYTSLNLLAHALNIATPKDDIDGSQVANVYYEEKNINRIITYCQKDVLTTAQIFLKINGEALIKEENIEIK